MPKPYTISPIRPFKGLHSATPREALEKGQFSRLENLNISKQGVLEKRKGIFKVNTNKPWATNTTAHLVGLTRGDETAYLWVYAGGTLYKGTPPENPTWTAISSTLGFVHHVIQFGTSGEPYNIQGVSSNAQTFGVNPQSNATGLGGGPQGTINIMYKSRMWVANTYLGSEGNRLYFSAPGGLTTWSAPSGGFIDVGAGDGQYIVALQVYNDNLYIFKNRSIWMLNADSEDQTTYTPRVVHNTMGCVGRNSCLLIEGFIFFLSADGIFRTDGTTFEEISAPIRDKFYHRNYLAKNNVLWNDAVHWQDKYIQIFGTSTGSEITQLVYDIPSEEWTTWYGSSLSLRGAFSYTEKAVDRVYFGSSKWTENYIVCSGDEWYRDNSDGNSSNTTGSSYKCYADLGAIDQETPGEWKRNYWLGLDLKAQLSEQIKLKDDSDTSYPPEKIKTPAVTDRALLRFPGTGRYRSLEVEWETETLAGSTPSAMQIYGLVSADSLRNPIQKAVN